MANSTLTVPRKLSPDYRPIKLERPCVTVIVDVEEDFDWSAPFSTENQSVESLKWIQLGHCMMTSLGLKPAYLVTYPVASSPYAADLLGSLAADGCEIGAQLHPWVTPPIEEEVSTFTSYPSNLPIDLERRKIVNLVAAIEKAVGKRPTIYKAGRYGLELSRAKQLVELGFQVDTSVMPYSNQTDLDGGPDFFGLPEQPFWMDEDKELLGLPSSQGLVGGLVAMLNPSILRRIYSPHMSRAHLPGVLSRLGLLERLRLSPEGFSFEHCRHLIDTYLKRGHNCFVVSFHSPSLQPGCTPYVRNQKQLNDFLDNLYMTLRYLLDDVGARPMSPIDIRAELS